MEDDLNFSGNGRRPQFFRKWKTTSIFQDMENDLNILEMEDDLKFSGKRRRLKFSEHGRPIQFNIG